MDIRDGLPGAVGRTPLIRVESLSEATGCTILFKAESLNPGGSVKDRAALWMVRRAEQEGALKPGGRIFEGTAGNTGIGLAVVANALGYGLTVVVPSNQSKEKIDTLRLLGATVELVPAAPFKDENNYYHVARRRAAESGGFWANQFENTANADAHYESTGPELWEQTGGAIDGVVMAAGTGGTIGGTTAFLKERRSDLVAAVIDPAGSALYSWVKRGVLEASGSSITEGIGIGRITANFARARLDDGFQGTDREVVEMAHHLLRADGLLVGGSAALNAVGAVRLARALGPGKTIVTILCDNGGRYQSTLFNPEWLAARELVPQARGLEFLSAH